MDNQSFSSPSDVTDSSSAFFFLWWFILSFLIRYTRLVVNAGAFWLATVTPLSPLTSYTSKDATIIIPSTLDDMKALAKCVRSIIRNNPFEIILVVKTSRVDSARAFCDWYEFTNVSVHGVPKLGKRKQMIKGLKEVKTQITIFADDDVVWPSATYLEQLLTAFEDPKVGGSGTNQRVVRCDKPNVWNFLGIGYLERRNFNTISTNYIDGGISTLSGRTSAYRTRILQNEDFYHAFVNDSWLGYILNTDDDKMLTRWTYSAGWKIKLQFLPEDVLFTTLESNPKFLWQCVRWARGHWRGNFRALQLASYPWTMHPWTLYASYFGSLLTPAFAVDGFLIWLFSKVLEAFRSTDFQTGVALAFFVLWILFTKVVKLIPHLRRYPSDIKFLPASILFSYLHGFINIYALTTLHITAWGSRSGVDSPTTTDRCRAVVSIESEDSGSEQDQLELEKLSSLSETNFCNGALRMAAGRLSERLQGITVLS